MIARCGKLKESWRTAKVGASFEQSFDHLILVGVDRRPKQDLRPRHVWVSVMVEKQSDQIVPFGIQSLEQRRLSMFVLQVGVSVVDL